MTDSTTADLPNTSDNLTNLRLKFASSSEKTQLQLIPEFVNAGEPGLAALIEFLRSTSPSAPADIVVGKVYTTLYNAQSTTAAEFLQTHFPEGLVPLRSERSIDYTPLQQLLAKQDFLSADRITLQKLCELAGSAAVARKWLYFSEVENFPSCDLQTINTLWLVHSGGQFGFSVQREVWLGVGRNWDKFWCKIGWKTGNSWTRYPQEFTWNLNAPNGHLPLSNQLRGVRVIASLLSHPAWSS